MSARAEPRFTRDVDVAVAITDDREAEALVHALGRSEASYASDDPWDLRRFAEQHLAGYVRAASPGGDGTNSKMCRQPYASSQCEVVVNIKVPQRRHVPAGRTLLVSVGTYAASRSFGGSCCCVAGQRAPCVARRRWSRRRRSAGPGRPRVRRASGRPGTRRSASRRGRRAGTASVPSNSGSAPHSSRTGPAGQFRALHCLPRGRARHRGGIDQAQLVAPGRADPGQVGDRRGQQRCGCLEPLVIAGLVGQVANR